MQVMKDKQRKKTHIFERHIKRSGIKKLFHQTKNEQVNQ